MNANTQNIDMTTTQPPDNTDFTNLMNRITDTVCGGIEKAQSVHIDSRVDQRISFIVGNIKYDIITYVDSDNPLFFRVVITKYKVTKFLGFFLRVTSNTEKLWRSDIGEDNFKKIQHAFVRRDKELKSERLTRERSKRISNIKDMYES